MEDHMEPQERLKAAADALITVNPDNIEAISDMSPGDLAKISADFGLKDKDYPKLIGTMIYIRKRLVEKQSRNKAFMAAFPERSVATASKGSDKFGTVTEVGETLTQTTLDVKAKRLENSQLYIHVYQMLQTNLYINYAVERMKVLDAALDIALDPLVAHRDRDRYMKIFLDETRKPDNAKQFEFNLNVQQNNINVVDVEETMSNIAKTMENLNASQLVEIMHQEKKDED